MDDNCNGVDNNAVGISIKEEVCISESSHMQGEMRPHEGNKEVMTQKSLGTKRSNTWRRTKERAQAKMQRDGRGESSEPNNSIPPLSPSTLSQSNTVSVPLEVSFIQEADVFEERGMELPPGKRKSLRNDRVYLEWLQDCAEILHQHIPVNYHTNQSTSYYSPYDCKTCNVHCKGSNFIQHLRGHRHQSVCKQDNHLISLHIDFPPKPMEYSEVYEDHGFIDNHSVSNYDNGYSQAPTSNQRINIKVSEIAQNIPKRYMSKKPRPEFTGRQRYICFCPFSTMDVQDFLAHLQSNEHQKRYPKDNFILNIKVDDDRTRDVQPSHVNNGSNCSQQPQTLRQRPDISRETLQTSWEGPHISQEGPQISREKPEIPRERRQTSYEGPHISQEGPQISRERPQISRERPEIPRERRQTSWEGPHISQEGPQISRERPQISRERPQIPRERRQTSWEGPHISQEGPQISRERPQISRERPEIPRERRQTSWEDPHISQEGPQISRERPKIPRERRQTSWERLQNSWEGPHISQERPEIPRERPEISRERPEISRERPEISRERPEISRERPRISWEGRPISQEGSQSQWEGPQISQEGPQISRERPEISRERSQTLRERPEIALKSKIIQEEWKDEYNSAREKYMKQCADILEPWLGKFRDNSRPGAFYRCRVCNCEGSAVTMLGHFKGRKHQKARPQDRYLMNFKLSHLPRKPKPPPRSPLVDSQDTPSSALLKPSPNKLPIPKLNTALSSSLALVRDSESTQQTRQALYDIDFTVSPCLGVEFIVEFPKSVGSDGSIDENVVFICDLCARKIQHLTLANHVLSHGHRMNYLRRVYPDLATQLKQSLDDNPHLPRDKQVADSCMTVQKWEGTPKLIRVVDEIYMTDIHMNSKRRPGVTFYSDTKAEKSSSAPKSSFSSEPKRKEFPPVQQYAPPSRGISSLNFESNNVRNSYEHLMQEMEQSVTRDCNRNGRGLLDVQDTNRTISTHKTPLLDPSASTYTTNTTYKRHLIEPSDPSNRLHTHIEKRQRTDPIPPPQKSQSAMASFLEVLKNTRIKNEEDATLATQMISILSQELVEFRSCGTSNGMNRRSPSPEFTVATFETNRSRDNFDMQSASSNYERVDKVKGNEELLALLHQIRNSS